MNQVKINTRPISPHLTVYKLEVNSASSILHRITGIVLSLVVFFSLFFLKVSTFHLSSYWFYSLIYSINFYTGFIYKIVFFFITLSLSYHLYTGIRHLVWDLGIGLDLDMVMKSSYGVIALSLLTSMILWGFY